MAAQGQSWPPLAGCEQLQRHIKQRARPEEPLRVEFIAWWGSASSYLRGVMMAERVSTALGTANASVVAVRIGDGEVLFDSAAGGSKKGIVEEMPAFSPDGGALVFASNREGDTELYVVMLSNGAGSPVRLTRSPGPDWLPRWLPDSFVLPGGA